MRRAPSPSGHRFRHQPSTRQKGRAAWVLYRSGLLMALMQIAAPPARAAEVEAPPWLHVVRRDHYDGINDDLVTSGLGVAALNAGKLPAPFADPLHPTFAELRRMNIARPGAASNGYGRLYGPGIDPTTEQPRAGDDRIAGDEVLAFADDGGGRQMIGMVLQVPAGFRPDRSCLVVIATPGSNNIWADMQRTGYWGLVHGCAVAWTDKGTGAGVHDIDTDQVTTTDGAVMPAARANGTAKLDAIGRDARPGFAASYPHRLAFKWAHAGWTQETDWGTSVLRAAEFGLVELGRRSNGAITRARTRVIAMGFSNGGGAVLRAAEADATGLLDGVVAMSPQIMTAPDARVVVDFGGQRRAGGARTIYDALTYGDLFKPCAALAVADAPALSGLTHAGERCTSLAEAGLLHGAAQADQAKEALGLLRDFGLQAEAEILTAYSALAVQGTLGQASQYGGFGVADRLCNLSFAAVDKEGRPVPAEPAFVAQLFGRELGGTPDTRVITTINDADPTGPRMSTESVSPSTRRQDYNVDADLCLRELAVGSSANAQRVQAGLKSVLATGNTRSIPTIIVHGRADPVEPPDFTSRPYVGLNSLTGRDTRLRYIEVLNGVHGEPEAGVPGLRQRFIPLSVYQLRAMEAMFAYLTEGRALPPSQVVRTTPPSGTLDGGPAVQASDLPKILDIPTLGDRIEVADGEVRIPR